MHPEVRQDDPGFCSICGMALVAEVDESSAIAAHHSTANEYMPLIVVIGCITLVTVALTLADARAGVFTLGETVRYFMAGFFLVFAGFKLIDVRGFADGYATYDVLAQRWKGYGYIYPLIELAFGLAMVVAYHPAWILWSEFGLMLFSGVGVAIKMAKHEQFQCACLGTTLKVPLTVVTLVEDFGMAALALLLLMLS